MIENKKHKVGCLLIATRKYKSFLQAVINSIDENFLNDHEKIIFVFTDEYQAELKSTSKIIQILIPDYKWPFATLYRYKIFCENAIVLRICDYLFYLDVDMKVTGKVGDEILEKELTMVYHPGFYSKKDYVGHWGSDGVHKDSTAWVEPNERKGYVAGGFNGGQTLWFLLMSHALNENIAADERRGIIAEHNDESHLNAFIKANAAADFVTKKLDPSYCMVEQEHLRRAWGISHLEPKIIALAKDHKLIRE